MACCFKTLHQLSAKLVRVAIRRMGLSEVSTRYSVVAELYTRDCTEGLRVLS